MKLTFLLLVLFYCCSLPAQEVEQKSVLNQYEIKGVKWVSKFPDTKVQEKNLLERLGEFIFGKKQETTLNKPISLVAIDTSTMFILDQGIRKLITVKENMGEIPQFETDNYPSLVGICKTTKDQFFFTDSKENKIFHINFDKEELVDFNDTIKLFQPTGIAYSQSKEEIWVVETAAHRISVFNLEGQLVQRIGNRGVNPGEFNYPTFIWIDDTGQVYIVDSMNFRIQILDKEGAVINSFGQIGDATGYLSRPKGIATDSYGNIYIVDALFHSVQIFDRDGNFLYHFGKQGRGNGQFWLPAGIFIDQNDFIYIADSYNARIQVFQLTKE